MLKAAIVGLGRWGRNLVDSVQGKSRTLQFTHAVVRRPDTARDYAARQGLELSSDFAGMLADRKVEAVVLTTPHSQHADQIVAAAAAGKPVFCEKPLALARADAERAVDACRRAGVALGLGYNKRFWPSMRELERIVASGELGEILHLEGHFSNESTRKFYAGWRELDTEAPAGGLTATGVHVLDAFINIAGPARMVHARLVQRETTADPVDTLSVFLEFSNRASGVLCGVRSTAQFWRVHVFGKQGSAEAIEDAELILRLTDAPPRKLAFEPVDALRTELEAFAHSVTTGAPYPITVAQMIDGVAALEAIKQSIAERGAVEISG